MYWLYEPTFSSRSPGIAIVTLLIMVMSCDLSIAVTDVEHTIYFITGINVG